MQAQQAMGRECSSCLPVSDVLNAAQYHCARRMRRSEAVSWLFSHLARLSSSSSQTSSSRPMWSLISRPRPSSTGCSWSVLFGGTCGACAHTHLSLRLGPIVSWLRLMLAAISAASPVLHAMWHLVIVGLALLATDLQVLSLLLRFEVVLDVQVAGRRVGHPGGDVGLDHLKNQTHTPQQWECQQRSLRLACQNDMHLLQALLREGARRWTIHPCLGLPENNQLGRVGVLLKPRNASTGSTKDKAWRWLLHHVVTKLLPNRGRRVGRRLRWRLPSETNLPGALPLRHRRPELVDRDSLCTLDLVCVVEIEDKWQWNLRHPATCKGMSEGKGRHRVSG